MDNETTLQISTLAQLHPAASSLLSFAGPIKVFLFKGQMGFGKTTFIKALCETLGATDHFSSPTYSIVNEYSYPDGKIFHFDLYRLKDPSELLDLGVEESLDSGEYCFIEWPEIMLPYIEGSYLDINILMKGEDRSIHALQKKI